MNTTSLNNLIRKSITSNWNYPALSDYNGQTLSFADVAERIARLHILFNETGVRKGDRIAVCGRNSANWATSFLAVLSYGAVVVPMLHDFHADTLRHLTEHCSAKMIFTDLKTFEAMDGKSVRCLKGAVSLEDFSPLISPAGADAAETGKKNNLEFSEKYPDGFGPEQFQLPEDDPEDLCVINYTSGSTGFSKGGMLPRRSLYSNITYAVTNISFLNPGDDIVSILPLAHMFGLSIEFLFPFMKGCHITFLGRVPAPTIVLKAFAEIRPKLIISVPLVLEKVVKNRIFPIIKRPLMRIMLALPFVRQKIYARINKELINAFGGNLGQMIVGGAPLNREAEELLMKIKFPVTVGYGMTECGPLISYAPWDVRPEGSCGRIVDGIEARIDSPDPSEVAGELWVRGCNVMNGYYNAPELTAEIFRDGWMNTGDLCQMDGNGFLYIRGRNKTMILGPSGQNIYPEEIEAKLNNLPLVAESLVVERDGKLVALVVPDAEVAKQRKLAEKEIKSLLGHNIRLLNHSVAPYERVSDFEIRNEEFEKTPKRSIKRFLYS